MGGEYLMRLGFSSPTPSTPGSIIWLDASSTPAVLARYVNDPLSPLARNVEFVKMPNEGRADVVATRDIAEGEEIFVDYGAAYWRGVKYRATKLSLLELGRHYSEIRKRGEGLADDQCRSVCEVYEMSLEKIAAAIELDT